MLPALCVAVPHGLCCNSAAMLKSSAMTVQAYHREGGLSVKFAEGFGVLAKLNL